MIRAVVWKELREQGLIAIALAVLGGGLLVAVAMFADPPVPGAAATDVIRFLGAGKLVTLMLVVTAGMVCGGALFAAEKEAGTLSFLEALPTARRALWRAKLIAGFVLAVVQVTLLLVVAWLLDVADGADARRFVVYATLAFAWGALGSTLARTTLGSVGVAIPAASFATFLFLIPISLFFGTSNGVPRAGGWALYAVLMMVTPLVVSWWRFTAPDRARAAAVANAIHFRRVALAKKPAVADSSREPDRTSGAPEEPSAEPKHAGRPGWGVGALVWLTARQLWLPAVVLAAFAPAFGCAMMLPDLHPLFVWPVVALAAGTLVGVLVFGDEQTGRSALFWGEHRLPVARAWWVKMALGLLLLAWLLVLMVLPSFVRAQFEPFRGYGHGRTSFATIFHSRVFDELGAQTWKYLLVPAAYGFAFGHVCGLLFRKLVVACGVALMLGGSAAALWLPSLLAGGVSHWQVWLPAIGALVTGRLVLRAWTGDRVATRAPVLRLVYGGSAVVLLFAVGLGYRAVQVRNDPGAEDDLTFVSSLPGYDENYGGREFRTAADRYARTVTAVADARRRTRPEERLELVIRGGWPEKDDADLAAWLDRMYEEPPPAAEEKAWHVVALSAAAHPIGSYDPPLLVSSSAATAAVMDAAKRMALALLVRGLQLQATGARDPAPFVAHFAITVALAKNVRRGAGFVGAEHGIEIERLAVSAAERWLERLGPRAELARAVARTAESADDTSPFDLRPHLLADRYVVRGLQQAPASWLTTVLTPAGGNAEQYAPEADLVAFAWSVPWERERTRRLIGLTPDRLDRAELSGLVTGRPGTGALVGRHRSTTNIEGSDTLLRAARRAVLLKAAVFAYQAEHPAAPSSADELVRTGYIARVPEDPFLEGRPFGYRVSTGETLRGPSRATTPGRPPDEEFRVPVAPGQVVLWSVGTNRTDEGGTVPPGGPNARDLVYLVPLPAK